MCCLVLSWCEAQEITQIIKGTIVDAQARYPLAGVTVVVFRDTTFVKATSSDDKGQYRVEGIAPGRYKMVFQLVSHQTDVVPQVIVSSGKQAVINREMEEAIIELEAIEVKAIAQMSTVNEMATVSTRVFDAEETGRYAGSRQDPARMASNFAGVQGADDSRNDIVVRGNSPLGVLYRVDGVNIPNPNHFAVAGSTGGPVSILNSKTLANSDFYTGAFPAEYGNSMAGVFDLKLRNGNQEKHEFSGQFGILGTEISAEGPIHKDSRASYLVSGRYANFDLMTSLGVDIGTNAIPKYQDATFKLNFPQEDGSFFSLFGMGGQSKIDIVISNQKDTSEIDLYSENDRDQYFRTAMGVIGATYGKPVNDKAYFQTTFSTSNEHQRTFHEYIIRHIDEEGEFVVDGFYDLLYYNFNKTKISNNSWMNYKLDKRNSIKGGIISDYNFYNFSDSIHQFIDSDWDVRWDYVGQSALLQSYIQWQHKFSDNVVLNTGWNAQYFTLNGTSSFIEPRIGLKWKLDASKSLSAAIGMHSQIQPEYTYFYMQMDTITGKRRPQNLEIGFSKSTHYVLSYDWMLRRNMRVKAETYYQQLSNIPVEVQASSFSTLNQGSGFTRFFPNQLQNTGTGTNYGVEFTLDKFFSKNYFFMLTASLYDSKYVGSDDVKRNTDFNGNYALNILGGTEFKASKKSTINIGTKLTMAGGKRYGIVDTSASNAALEVIFLDDRYNEFQFDDYFRLDLKLGYKINARKMTHEIAIDIVNLLDTKNTLSITYAPRPGSVETPFRENYQLGRLPLFYYKVDF